MSGRDLVDELRSGARPLPREPRRSGLLDIAIMLVAVVSIGSLAYVGYNTVFGDSAPPPAPVEVAEAAPAPSASVEAVAWTDDDTAFCTRRAQAAARNPNTGGAVLTNSSIGEGVAGLATATECKLTRKPTRFCGASGNAELVALVNDYLTRMDLVKLGIGAQGAPMAIAGGMLGGEPAAGSGMYDQMAQETFKFMASYDANVTEAVRGLARNGLVKADDFRAFGVGGVPEHIATMFKGVTATADLCA